VGRRAPPHGDLAKAEVKLKDANQRGPHWADPLKAWGDVLVKQGKTKEALAKYNEALKYAPNWKQLKEAREAAVSRRLIWIPYCCRLSPAAWGRLRTMS
jgi:tetratricopeptide (TPR) repeat protein